MSWLVIKIIGFILVVCSGSALIDLYIHSANLNLPYSAGGILGHVVSSALVSAFNLVGATVILVTFLLIGVTLLTGLSWLEMERIMILSARRARRG